MEQTNIVVIETVENGISTFIGATKSTEKAYDFLSDMQIYDDIFISDGTASMPSLNSFVRLTLYVVT